MIKIHLIGCGGIGSWVAKYLNELIEEYSDEYLFSVYASDNDIVEEKNIFKHNQNFETENLLEKKSEIISKRYDYIAKTELMTESNIDQLKGFNYVILAVDNHKTRKLVYEYCHKNKIALIDLRAQGTIIRYVVLEHDKPFEYYEKKFFSNKDVMEKKGSCQNTFKIDNKEIDYGNRIIAMMGILGILLKLIKEEKLSSYDFKFAY